MAHEVPLGGLGVAAHCTGGEQAPEDEGQQVVVGLVHNVGEQYLAAEAEHAAYGAEVDVERGVPADVQEAPQVDDGDVGKLLPGQAPVAVAAQCQRDAHDAAAREGGEAYEGLLAVHHVAEHVGGMCGAQACHEQRGEYQPRQGHEPGLAEVAGYEGCTQVEHAVEGDGHESGEPEDGVIVAVGGLLHVGECCREAALLQRAGYGGEDGQHAHHAILGRRQQAPQHDAYGHAEQLRGDVVDGSPQQAFGRALLQTLTHWPREPWLISRPCGGHTSGRGGGRCVGSVRP